MRVEQMYCLQPEPPRLSQSRGQSGSLVKAFVYVKPWSQRDPVVELDV